MDVSTLTKLIEWVDEHKKQVFLSISAVLLIGFSFSWFSFYRTFIDWKKEEEQLMALKHTQEELQKMIEALNSQSKFLDEQIELKKQKEKQKEEAVINQAIQGGGDGVSEYEVSYWRKQLLTYAVLRGVLLQIVGRSSSSYDHAVKLEITVEPVEKSKPLDAMQVAQALDFLQLYGYVESFDGKTAIVHVRLN